MVALEPGTSEPELTGEVVQLIEGVITDEVGPPALSVRPDRSIDQDRHVGAW